jgi:hypothetical protein
MPCNYINYSKCLIHGSYCKNNPETCPLLTRDSCLDCVNKHIGIVTTLYEKYTKEENVVVKKLQYLKIIGNLYEAEEESENWPDIKNTVRNLRLSFMQSKVLDVLILANILKEDE